MRKKFLMTLVVIAFSVILFGCQDVNIGQSAYEIWKNSDEAIDMNEDRKIDEVDFQLYLEQNMSPFEIWKDSDEAEDLNGDRKIDEDDYNIYLQPDLSDYEIWKDSDEAEDLNDDTTIDEDDYDLYLESLLSDYERWKDSDDAEDLNGDRKIDEDDYALFLEPQLSDYEIWKDSNDAEDLNGDRKIDEDDYDIFLMNSEFIGEYYITNYNYEGYDFYLGDKDTYLKDLGDYLNDIAFSIDKNGDVLANLSASTILAFGDDFEDALEGLNNMSISRLSPYLVVLDTYITINNVDVDVTLYLTEIENGFSTSYIHTVNDFSGTMTFDIYLKPEQSDYDIWKDSDKAEDLNDDSIIDEDDYDIYLVSYLSDYETWKDSDDAEDLNGDRKINEDDYNLYLEPQESDYEIWKDSDDAKDLNDDRKINEDDYDIYLLYSEFVGEYTIANYNYEGDNFYLGNKDTYLKDLGGYLNGLVFSIDENGDVIANIPASTILAFGNDFEDALEGINNMTISRISPYLVVLDTYITVNGLEVDATLYLTEINNGFSTSYVYSNNNYTGTVSFDIIEID
jgi:hypothetical protein